ncbi:MAG: acyl-CoA dehydrogenase [Methanomassiliicoccales archaeon]|nr:MAG: acyl-CoA dehydrogenase [Methanomassiliicoccales archaeon]
MDFRLTKEQEMIRSMVSEFAEKEVAPLASEIDETGEFPWQTIKKMAKLNLLGLPIPKEYGGAGVDTISYVLAVEEISKRCASTGVIMSVHTSVGTYPIYLFGTEEQKQKFVVPLALGERIGAFALTEPGAGSDAAGVQTTAVLKGDRYILNGSKIFITNGGVAGSVIVMAMTDKSKGHRGITALIVEKDTEGFTYGSIEKTMGVIGSDTCELVFEDCKIPKENLLGTEGMGFRIAMKALDGGRIGIAAQALGIAEAALEESVKYAKEREQFGKPIAKFQAIQWMIANMAAEIEAARMLVYHAAYSKDRGVNFTKEAAMAKCYASEVAMRATTKALQIHGGYGYTKDYPVERFFRDAKITEIYEGTSEIQRMVIASNLLK